MKSLLLTACLIVLMTLTGCGSSPKKCYNTVYQTYPKSQIINIPDKNYAFIVIKPDGAIFYVETMNITNTDITFTFPIRRADG